MDLIPTTVLDSPDIERNTTDIRLDDPAWITAEFAAIMAASGIVDRRTVTVANAPAWEGAPVRCATRPRQTYSTRSIGKLPRGARVRSPPHAT